MRQDGGCGEAPLDELGGAGGDVLVPGKIKRGDKVAEVRVGDVGVEGEAVSVGLEELVFRLHGLRFDDQGAGGGGFVRADALGAAV